MDASLEECSDKLEKGSDDKVNFGISDDILYDDLRK